MHPRALAIALLTCLHVGAAGAQPLAGAERRLVLASGIIDAAVIDALDASARVGVMVRLATPRGEHPRLRSDAVLARLAGRAHDVHHRYARVRALALSVGGPALARLAGDPDVLRVSLDHRIRAQLNEGVPLVNLDTLHAMGLTGSGITVAVVDTGIDFTHLDLVAAYAGEECFCIGEDGPVGCCPNELDTQSGAGSGVDDAGHGTNVAGIVTSDDIQSPLGGAPDAALVAIKVLDLNGLGDASDLIAALEWILLNRPDVQVVNLSLGGGLYAGDCDLADATTESYAEAIDNLHDTGVISIAGAGNNGSGVGMIAPACIHNAVSVGGVWDADVGTQTKLGCTDTTTAADQVACWSNASTTTDVFAPGALIVTTRIGGNSAVRSGTSFATPFVAACAAALRQARPQMPIEVLATALQTSPTNVTDDTNGLSYPRLDCAAALDSVAAGVPAGQATGIASAALLACLGAAALVARRRA